MAQLTGVARLDVRKPPSFRKRIPMHCLRLLTLLLALQSAPVIAVLHNHEVMLAVQFGNVIYTFTPLNSRHRNLPRSISRWPLTPLNGEAGFVSIRIAVHVESTTAEGGYPHVSLVLPFRCLMF
jgi:hypothetical protein